MTKKTEEIFTTQENCWSSANETQTFTGTPMISHRIQQSNDSNFVFNILSPEEYKGIYERSLREIESLEK